MGVKIVMECRQPAPRRGAAKQKREGVDCSIARGQNRKRINGFYKEVFMARSDLRSKRNGPVDHFERRAPSLGEAPGHWHNLSN